MNQGNLFDRPPPRDTLAEARASVQLARVTRDGIHCPCCGRFTRDYKRKLNSTMARQLIVLARDSREWIHASRVLTASGLDRECAKLRYWKLIEEKPPDDDSPRSGLFRVTRLGREFVAGRARVPEHAYVTTGGEVVGFSDETTDIRKALGARFSYEELMRS